MTSEADLIGFCVLHDCADGCNEADEGHNAVDDGKGVVRAPKEAPPLGLLCHQVEYLKHTNTSVVDLLTFTAPDSPPQSIARSEGALRWAVKKQLPMLQAVFSGGTSSLSQVLLFNQVTETSCCKQFRSVQVRLLRALTAGMTAQRKDNHQVQVPEN